MEVNCKRKPETRYEQRRKELNVWRKRKEKGERNVEADVQNSKAQKGKERKKRRTNS
jgi:hypothetical protein